MEEFNSEDKIIAERKEKVIKFVKTHPSLIFYSILFLLLILGLYIRYLPLSDHGGLPGLWDITTNDYTLGPDLDPFVFLRYAKEMITTGSIAPMDTMRNVPLFVDTTTELQMVSYMIVLTYKIVNIFGEHSINFAGAFMPVWVFGLTIIAFFLFVRMIFLRKIEDESESKSNYLKANIIALISTLFMIIMPGFLSRTVAGIPEKESIGFFFMFLAFYFYLKAWKSEKLAFASLFGVLAGVSTALMGLSWGGVTYVYVTMGLSGLVALILNKIEIKESLVYCLWLIASLVITQIFTNRSSLISFVTGTDTGLATLTFAMIILHNILWKTKLNEILKLNNLKIPRTFITFILGILAGAILILIVAGPSFFVDKIESINKILIKPITGRWSTTVAENAQPYFSQWVGNFGSTLFWLFIIGSVVLFKKMLSKIEKKEAWILTLLYFLFLFGLIFSRYAPHPAVLDGEGFLSKLLYYGFSLLLVSGFIYYYFHDHKSQKNHFNGIEFEYIFLFSLFVLCLFTARSAVRLIMVLVPIAPIFFSYLLVETGFSIKKYKDQTMKLITIIIFALLLIIAIYHAWGFFKSIQVESYSFVPSSYTQQWQKAMDWVRTSTPANAVFAHWWDYGYWVQSIGDRATVTDGGNFIVWWNYLTGRFVLTGDNQPQALEFLWNHNATHLLIDSTDIGKYGAYSQIGSNENYDRLSQGPFALPSDPKQVQETKDGLSRSYYNPAGTGRVSVSPIEEDIEYNLNGTIVHLFKENSGLVQINLKYTQDNSSISFKQPQGAFVSNGQQMTLPIRYLYYGGKIHDFKIGINATVYPIQRLYQDSTGAVQLDNLGAAIYVSPRVQRGLMGQIYILNDPFNKFANFKLAYTQPDPIIESINSQGNVKLGEFIYYQGIRGPIKIWDITYTGKEKVNEEYLLKWAPADIPWAF